MRLGIFGGTFDPPHIGHLIVAQDALSALGLDRVLFVPAAVPPHKRERVLSPAELRLAMLREATAGDPRFDVADLELRRSGPSYTVDTLRELRERDPASELSFLLGADQFRTFHTWRSPSEITQLADLAVLTRAGEARFEPAIPVRHQWVEVTRVDVSATAIRRRVESGLSIRYLVSPSVEALIQRESLYRSSAADLAAGAGGSRARCCGPSSGAAGTIDDTRS